PHALGNGLRPCSPRAVPHAIVLSDRQRNGGGKDVVWVKVPFGFNEPRGVAAKAHGRTGLVASREQIRIAAGECHGVKSLTCGAYPLAMLSLLLLIRSIGKRCKDLDQHMIAAQAEGRCLFRYPRGGAPELVGEDGTTRRDCGLHGINQDINAAAAE